MTPPGALGRRRGPVAAALVTGVVTLVAFALLTASVARGTRRAAEETFIASADQSVAALEQQIRTYLDELRDIGAFMANARTPTAEEFAGFVEGTGIFEQLPSLVGVLYLHRVPADRLSEFVAAMQGTIPDFGIVEIGPSERDVRYVLSYYVPGSVDLQLPIGTDVTPIAALTALLNTQGERGEAIAGSFQEDPYLLAVADEMEFEALETLLGIDFFLGVPSYSSGVDGRPPGELLGWVGAPVDDFASVLAAASAGQPEDLGVSLTVDLADTGFGHRADLERAAVQPGEAGDREDAAFEVTRQVDVDGVDLTVTVWSRPGADNLPPAFPVLIVGGVVVTVLAATVVYLRLRARQRERQFTSELREREESQRDILDSISDAMVVLDASGTVVGANPAWRLLCADARREGEAPEEPVVGVEYAATLAGPLRGRGDELDQALARVLQEGESVELDLPVGTGAGHRWFAVRMTPRQGRRGAVVVHSDITDRKRSHDELELRATRDDLTGVLNRQTLEAEADVVVAEARGRNVAVIFVDLDGFKPINDEHGHAVGDQVLRVVGRRLRTVVRATDRVGRYGGDEFVVLVGPLDDPSVATQTANRILQAFDSPIRVDGLELRLRVSVGVAAAEVSTSTTFDDLVEAADQAMYLAKRAGGGRAVEGPVRAS